MMLTFIFKYTWIGMIILVYIIWSVKSIKDIIHTKCIWKNEFDIGMLDDDISAWIGITLFAIFGGSFIYWLLGGVIE